MIHRNERVLVLKDLGLHAAQFQDEGIRDLFIQHMSDLPSKQIRAIIGDEAGAQSLLLTRHARAEGIS